MELTANYSRIHISLSKIISDRVLRVENWNRRTNVGRIQVYWELVPRISRILWVKRISIFTSIRSWISHCYRLPNIRSESCEQLTVVLGRNRCQNCENQ